MAKSHSGGRASHVASGNPSPLYPPQRCFGRAAQFKDGVDAKRTRVMGGDRRWWRGKRAGGEKMRCRAAPSGLRITTRFLAGALRRAIKRLQSRRPSGSFASFGACG
jgi:hypothetical protein